MCALVANANHSIQPDSGNCWALPDVPVIAAVSDTVCRAGPGQEYTPIADLAVGDQVLARGLSPNERWWYAQNPQNLQDSCWLSKDAILIKGDISDLPVIQPPSAAQAATPASGAPYGSLYVEITGISVDSQNQYVVEYITYGFTEELPGTHVHFFFDTVPPDEAGVPGNGPWILYGGPRPFTLYKVSDRPKDATRMCALVANPNHSVQPQSGNCWNLP
jgi:hypothetical protein